MDLEICRICGGPGQLKNILEEGSEMINKLFTCVNINIHPGDLLPKLICDQCAINLDICYQLKKQCESTQERLMLEIQKNQNVHRDVNEQTIDVLNRESGNEYSDCERVDLSQCSEDIFGIDRMNVCSSTKEVFVPAASNVREDFGNDEGNEDLPSMQSEFLTDTSVDSCASGLKEFTEAPMAIEFCSIDLLSSSASSNGCDESEKLKFNSALKDALTCDTCHEVFTKNHEYRRHVKEHGVERFQCIQCCKFFPSRSRLKRHEEIHNVIPTHQCSHCNRSYRALYNLQRHIKSAHVGKKSLECNVCNISFSRMDVLKRHLQLHSNEKKFECSLCSRSFKTKDYLYAHHKTRHIPKSDLPKTKKTIKKDKNQCGYCGKLFKSSFAFKNHLLIHTNEKPYKCETCNKNFRTIAALTIHQSTHDDYRPYQCDLCLKSFRQTAHLKEHRALHLGNAQKHVCSICEESFTKKGNLKAHMRTHAKEKAFKCAECTAEFSFMHLLQRHASKVHSRSVHQLYTLNDIDDTPETYGELKNNDDSEPELYHYIDTISDENNDEFEKNYQNSVDLVGNDHEAIETLSTELQVISSSQAEQRLFYDKDGAASYSEAVVGDDKIRSLNFTINENITEPVYENENNLREQKVDILVTEETKLTSSVFNVSRIK